MGPRATLFLGSFMLLVTITSSGMLFLSKLIKAAMSSLSKNKPVSISCVSSKGSSGSIVKFKLEAENTLFCALSINVLDFSLVAVSVVVFWNFAGFELLGAIFSAATCKALDIGMVFRDVFFDGALLFCCVVVWVNLISIVFALFSARAFSAGLLCAVVVAAGLEVLVFATLLTCLFSSLARTFKYI